MRPLIGVMPLYQKDNGNIWINPGYLRGIEAGGGAPILLHLSEDPAYWEQLCDLCDGFLFTGGPDVEPTLYGREKIPECGYILPARDNMEITMLRSLLKTKKPILGICRGAQLINVAAGGTMYQDLPTQRPGPTDHNQIEKAEFTVPTHTVEVLPDTLLSRVLGTEVLPVNSMHHQAVWETAPGLRVSAVAPDGLTEAVESLTHPFVLGVQWHPEFLWPEAPRQKALFSALVRACET